MGHRDIVLKSSGMDSSWKNSRRVFFLNYLPLLNYDLLKNEGMKFCKFHTSKSKKARDLKLVSDEENI